ncbi:MAG: MmgE/PrpD family protein [Thermomicrobiales bacterium]
MPHEGGRYHEPNKHSSPAKPASVQLTLSRLPRRRPLRRPPRKSSPTPNWRSSTGSAPPSPAHWRNPRIARTPSRTQLRRVPTKALSYRKRRGSAFAAALAGLASPPTSPEFDDVHRGSTIHGAAPIIPAAPLRRRRGAGTAAGRTFLLATALGYEAGLRAGEAVNPSHYCYWHPTGTAATFGAAAASGTILGLDADQMRDALGSAGTQAAGLWEFNADGTMSKHLHPGKAALNGVLSADLAKHGFTGAGRILEGERGFIRAMSDGGDVSRITADLGTAWKVSENWYKMHSCCGHTHTAIDTALLLRAEQGWGDGEAVRKIASIDIALYGPGYEIVREMNPRTPYQAKFSLAYVVAAALTEGRVGLAQFAPERFSPEGTVVPAIHALLERTTARIDPDLTALYPARWPARLTLTLRDGQNLVGGSDYPRGNPENPAPLAELEDKFRDLVAPRYSADLAERAIAAVNALESCPDMASWLAALRPA